MDRLKPAYIDDASITVSSPQQDDEGHNVTATANHSQPPATSSTTLPLMSPYKTRSGRHVHWPKRFAEYRTFT